MIRHKRYAAILLALVILAASILPVKSANAASDPRYIRVRLSSYGSLSSVSVRIDGSYYIKEAPSIPIPAGTTFTVKVTDGKLYIELSGVTIPIGTTVTLKRCESTSATNWLTLTSKGYHYPGDLTFAVNGSSLLMTLRVYIEDYLMGVVPYEMADNWQYEALKAQVIASRTFAVNSMSSTRSYDVVDTSSSQVYKSYNPANTNIYKAIQETSGQVLYWNGKISDGQFSDSNGGQTRAYKPYWGTTNTYHSTKDDPYDLANPKSAHYTVNFPKEVTSSNAIDSRLSALVLPYLQTAVEDAGYNVTLTKDDILGFNSVKLHTLPAANTRGSYDSNSYEFQKFTTEARVSVNGKTVKVSVTIPTSELKTAFNNATSYVKYANKYYTGTTDDGKSLTITLRGWGHGIGMSQKGADYMAQLGMTVDDIIDFYYTGCYLVSLIGAADSLPSKPSTVASGTMLESASLLKSAAESASTNGSVSKGESVMVLIKSGLYSLVRTNAGKMGFVLTEKVSSSGTVAAPSDPDPEASGTVISTTLNVRSGPGTTYTLLGTLKKGDVVQILEVGTNWHKILYAGDEAYVCADYIELAEALVKEPTVIMVGRVTSETLNVRKGKSTSYGILGTLLQGELVAILEEGSWYTISYNGGTGYISAKYVEEVSADELVRKGTVNCSKLTVREGPGSGTDALGTLKRGAEVKFLGSTGKWYRILYNNKEAWVYGSYITLDEDLVAETLPESETLSIAGEVIAPIVSVRKGAGTGYAEITALKSGATVTVTGDFGEWYRVIYDGKNEGYVQASCILTVNAAAAVNPTPTPTAAATPTPTPTVTATPTAEENEWANIPGFVISDVYFRDAPSTSGTILATLTANTPVCVEDVADNWYKVFVAVEGEWKEGYVSKRYITTETPENFIAVEGTTTSGLNLRKGPAATYEIAFTVGNGSELTVLDSSCKWYLLLVDGKAVFANGNYININ